MESSVLILVIGAVVVLAVLVKAAFERLRMPALVGFLLMGFALRLLDGQWTFLAGGGQGVFDFLANVGVICLLFRVGLSSDLSGLLGQLRRASLVWLGDVGVSGGVGFLGAYYLLGLGLIPSLFVGVTLTVTSVGIPLAVWSKAGKVNTPEGELLLDVAELDDISGIVLMAILFAVVPILRGDGHASLVVLVAQTSGWVLVKLVAFGLLCFVFSRYAEVHVTRFSERIEPAPEPMILVVGVGFIIAALAGLLGFSMAIGAFFAGLIFSRDPQAVGMRASFDALYDLFYPFFFVGIGLGIDPGSLTAAVGLGAVALLLAIAGKVAGAGGVTFLTAGPLSRKTAGILVSISMIPRAEIAMVIIQHGRKLGDWAVPPKAFSAMVLVSAATCLLAPVTLGWALRRFPPGLSARKPPEPA